MVLGDFRVGAQFKKRLPPRAGKSLVPASVHGGLGTAEIAQQMRHLLGPTEGGGGQNAPFLAADEEMKRSPAEGEDL